MTVSAETQHAAHVDNLTANAGKTDGNYRKKTRQLGLRNWLSPMSQTDPGLTRTGYASANGMSLYVMDEAEPDRPAVVVIRNREEAYAIMELAARFINERDALDPSFNYKGHECDRITSATGADEYYAVQFENRSDDFHSWPSTTRHIGLTGAAFRVLRAVMSRQD